MNKKDFGKLLADLHEDLKNQIDDLKHSVTEAKRLKNSLKSYFEKGEEIINKVTNEETGIEAYHTLAISTKKTIDTAKTSADEKLQSITDALEAVQSNITEMEEAYESFTEINEKLTDETTGLDAIQSAAEDVKSEIVAVKSDAGTLYKEIRKFRDNAAEYDSELLKMKDSAAVTLASIEANHEDSNKLKAQINDIFKLGSKGALSNYFVERRNQLFWISVFWIVLSIVLLVATVWLAIVFIIPVANELKNPKADIGVEVFLLRFAIVTPTLFGALYALKQYAHERRLYEKYAFKTVTTYSIEASIGTLVRSVSRLDHDKKAERIVDFAIKAFGSIYSEPVEPMNDKWILRGGNKILDVTAEIQQDVGEMRKDVDKMLDPKEPPS